MLDGTRVVDRTTQIAGPYCTKLLADAGADVACVAAVDDGSGLFEYLHASKRLTEDTASLAAADILVTDEPVDLQAVWAENPALVVVTITPFGCDGPWAGRPATEFTLQAACGSTATRGLPENPPLAAGGRLGEWLTGTYAAVGAIAALAAAQRSGKGEHVDVAMLDCMTVAMTTFQPVFSSFMGWPPVRGTGRAIEVPSIEPTADGYVVFTTNSAQQFESMLLMIGRGDWVEDKALARPQVRFKRRDEFSAAVHAFTRPRTSAEVLEEAAAWRIPAGPVLNGETVTAFEQFVARGVFQPSSTGRFRQPRPPYRIGGSRSSVPADTQSRSPVHRQWELPLTGIRILDCTAWWAGPAASHVLACLGADVIKVEAAARPDLMRFTSTKRPGDGPWWEWGPLFHGVNVGKRAITLDLTRPEGVDLFERLLPTADAVLENYTPRVMEQFGLGWDRIHEVNPRALMVRMPAFGLDGPWRDRTGFAQTMECIAGMAWVTGFPDGPPVLVRGACDPLAGAHAAFATMLALAERDRCGEGMLVEAAMVEAAVNVAAQQVIDFDLTGTLPSRTGNRSAFAAPQGVYQCAGEDRWVALSVTSDEEWRALVGALGDPAWAQGLDDADSRFGAQDRIDDELASWCADRDPDEIAELLASVGVPAATVMPAIDAVHNPQLRHRGLYEDEEHPVTGTHPIPGLPFRFSRVDRWSRRPSPTIGEHNDEVLGEVASPDELDKLRATGVIGEGLAGGD